MCDFTSQELQVIKNADNSVFAAVSQTSMSIVRTERDHSEKIVPKPKTTTIPINDYRERRVTLTQFQQILNILITVDLYPLQHSHLAFTNYF